MSEPFNLPAYLARIGYDGPRAPTHEALADLLAAHMNSIHFENLDVLFGRPISLDLGALQQKIVRDRRGGYCFEQMALFEAALRAFGFDCVSRAARVTVALPLAEAPRGHQFAIVRLPEGEFVADPGFGGYGCRTPIPLDGTPVSDGGETYRFENNGAHRTLMIDTPDKTMAAWSFGAGQDYAIDFEVGNWFMQTRDDMPFRNFIMLRAMIPGGRVTVMNRDVTIRRDGETSTMQLADRKALRALLHDTFGFDLPEVESLRVPAIPEWT